MVRHLQESEMKGCLEHLLTSMLTYHQTSPINADYSAQVFDFSLSVGLTFFMCVHYCISPLPSYNIDQGPVPLESADEAQTDPQVLHEDSISLSALCTVCLGLLVSEFIC